MIVNALTHMRKHALTVQTCTDTRVQTCTDRANMHGHTCANTMCS